MDYKQLALICGLIVVVLAILRGLTKRNKDAQSLINFDDLLIGDDGKISKAAVVMYGSFILTSWVLFYQTLKGASTDVIYAAYIGAWVAPVVARIIKGPVNADSQS